MLIVIIYSFIQGLTEFIPVSSQGHLIVFDSFYSVENYTKLTILQLNILAHFGSLFAILIYYFRTIWSLAKSIFFIMRPDIDRNANILLNLIISSVPIFFVGFYFAKYFKIDNDLLLLIIGLSSIIFGIVLYFIDRFCLRIRNLDTITFTGSFFIGLSQCLALIPGVSRSGAVLTFMRFNGFSRQNSVFYTNLLAIPVLFGAMGYLIIENFYQVINYNFFNLYSFVVFICSFFFSILFIHFFVSWVRNFSLALFVYYRVIFGLLVLFLFYYK